MASGKRKTTKKSKTSSIAVVEEAATPIVSTPIPDTVEVSQELVNKSSSEPLLLLIQEDGNSLGDSLFNALMSGASTEQIVSELIRIYSEGNSDIVCCSILNLVGKASGAAHAELDATALKDDTDMTAILEEMYARVPTEAAIYPFVKKDSKYRVFRTSYRRFFVRLIELCYNANILRDNIFLPTILRWLIAMSESKARCFRHTSIVALLSIVGSLNGLIQSLNNRMPSQVRGGKQQISDLHENIQILIEIRNNIISQAIHQRPRDVAPEIRLLVFETLEEWIIKYDEEFAENKYFRYFGMALYDKRPEIRIEALNMIKKVLTSTPDSGNRMFLFLQYFAKRLVEMCSDINTRCAELAISVIVLILKVYSEEVEGKELLDNEMIDRVLLTLFDERPSIRHEAGVLLQVFIESRIPVDKSNINAYQKAGMELLCAFASTLRSQYNEVMPERYLIDALYNPNQEFSNLLQNYTPVMELAASDDVEETIVGLSITCALLEKLQGKMNLGPIPKEDRRQTNNNKKKISILQQETIDNFVTSLSCEIGVMLPGILEKHRGDINVLCGVSSVIAAMNLKVFTSLKQVTQINSLITLLRKETSSLPYCEEVKLNQITSAWLTLANEDHPFKSEAKGQVQELLKQVLKQLFTLQKKSEKFNSQIDNNEMLHIWGRVNIISSLVSLMDQWGIFKVALVHNTNSNNSPELLQLILSISVRCLLWKIHNEQQNEQELTKEITDFNTDSVSNMIGELLSCIFQIWNSNSLKQESGFNKLFVESMVYLYDICALPYYTMSQVEQDVIVEKFSELSEILSSILRELKEKIKDAEQKFKEGGVLSEVAKFRRELSHYEASQLRITSGIVRLIMLNRISEDLTPRILLQWIQAPTKTISDVFRCLFRTLRDRSNDSFTIEKSILLATYHYSIDALYQMGFKLSSMHWPLPDKYYNACVNIIKFGIDFATTTDPAMLQAIVPYCSKLLKTDALYLAHALAKNEVLTSSTDANVRIFISSIRRAAKLENNVTGNNLMPSPRSLKRPRDEMNEISEEYILNQQEQEQQDQYQEENNEENEEEIPQKQRKEIMEENDQERLLALAAKTIVHKRPRRRRTVSSNSPSTNNDNNNNNNKLKSSASKISNRVTTSDGWRVRPGEEEKEEVMISNNNNNNNNNINEVQSGKINQSKNSKSVKAALTTQENNISSIAAELDSNEIFIATQEFD